MEKMIKSWLCFLLLMVHLPAWAASLEVRVLQKGTGDPVEGATVVVGTGGDYDTSDKKGMVTFSEVSFPVHIKILNSGYQTLEKDLATENDKAVFYLSPLTMEGEALTVVAERVQEKTSKVVLATEELRRAPGAMGDPIKVLQSMPGVVSAGDGNGVIYVRGSDVNDNGAWINGLPVNYMYHWGGMISVINPDLVQDFNAFLGGFPVEYGDYMGGFLDARLRPPKKDRIHQKYVLGVYNSSLLVEGPLGGEGYYGHNSFYVAARRSFIDLLFTPAQLNDFISAAQEQNQDANQDEDPDSIVVIPKFYDIQADLRHELSNGVIDLQYFAAGDEVAMVLNSPSDVDPEVVGELNSAVKFQTIGLVWDQNLSDKWNMDTVLSYEDFGQRFTIGADPVTGEPYRANSSVRQARLQSVFHFQANSMTRYDLGVEAIYAEAPLDLYISRPPAFDDPNWNFSEAEKFRIDTTVTSRSLAPFIKQRMRWGERLTTTLGVRYSDIDGSGDFAASALSPRTAVEYQLTDKMLLTVSWGLYQQLPGGEKILKDFGNPRLEYTEAEHRIIGMQYALAPMWKMQVEAYHKPMRNLVVTIDGVEPPDNYLNEGTGEAYGLDVLIKRELSGGRMGWLSYSYMESSRYDNVTKKETESSSDQPHTLTAVWSQPMGQKWTVGLRLHAHTGRPYTPMIGRTGMCVGALGYEPCGDQENAEQLGNFSHWRAEYGDPNSKRLPFYYRLDVRIDRAILYDTWNMKVFFDIQNATNAANVSGYDYGDKYQYTDNPREQIGMPFFPFFGVEANF